MKDAHPRIGAQPWVEKCDDGYAAARVEVAVHLDLEQVGRNDLQKGRADDGDKRQHGHLAVSRQVTEQTLHQPPVVGFAEHFLFVGTVRH